MLKPLHKNDVKAPEIFNEALELYNQICLYNTELVRLVGYGEDSDDCYYVCLGIGRPWESKKFWGTAVCGIDSLKPYLPKRMYDRLDSVFGFNQCGPAEQFECVYDDRPYPEVWFSGDSNGCVF